MTIFGITDADTDMTIFETADTDADTDADMDFLKNRGHGHETDSPRTRVSANPWSPPSPLHIHISYI